MAWRRGNVQNRVFKITFFSTAINGVSCTTDQYINVTRCEKSMWITVNILVPLVYNGASGGFNYTGDWK